MDDSKGILKSGTVAGGAIAAVPLVAHVLAFFGVPIPPEMLNATVLAFVSAFGGALAIWRRVKAKKTIDGLL